MQFNTLTPVWNEIWQVKNVPTTAVLSVIVRDKDHKAPIDKFIGKFETTIYPGAKEAEIQGPMHMRNRGTFWLKVAETFECCVRRTDDIDFQDRLSVISRR